MNTSSKNFEPLLDKLRRDYPDFKFKAGRQTHWSPRVKTIYFNESEPSSRLIYAVLHELAHAVLDHSNYTSDFELLKMEADAWQLATEVGHKYSVDVSDDYIQQCLDTYRDWLHRRSTCPICGTHVMQKDPLHYQCHNCQTTWQVTTSRFLRPYRRNLDKAKSRR